MYDKIIFYFMTDGDSAYPDSAIKQILNENSYIEKLEFYSISYGSAAKKDTLQKMASQFPIGKLIDAPNADALEQSFKEINPCIY